MVKKIPIVAVIIIVFGVLVWLYFSWVAPPVTSPEEEKEERDEISELLEDLREYVSDALFSKLQPAEVYWNISEQGEIKEIILSGKGVKAEEAEPNNLIDARNYLTKERGFQFDVYNNSAGPLTQYAGYKRGDFVCTIASQDESKDISGIFDIVVKCGKIED